MMFLTAATGHAANRGAAAVKEWHSVDVKVNGQSKSLDRTFPEVVELLVNENWSLSTGTSKLPLKTVNIALKKDAKSTNKSTAGTALVGKLDARYAGLVHIWTQPKKGSRASAVNQGRIQYHRLTLSAHFYQTGVYKANYTVAVNGTKTTLPITFKVIEPKSKTKAKVVPGRKRHPRGKTKPNRQG